MTRAAIDPRDRLFAVLDDQAAVEHATEALQSIGIADRDIEVLAGSSAADGFDGTGAVHGPLARIRRAFEFSLADQMPDLAWYEAALREGRFVVGVRTRDAATTRRAVAGLTGAGGHFINRFGRLQTEEYARWRGREPDVHVLLRR
ncbi:MAG TPA: hypothetical protein VKR30_10220 [Candidatus Limnocylindrales bacterium]|nr:hypothetical protein [Candidatus Limnocylindrales bacterium]